MFVEVAEQRLVGREVERHEILPVGEAGAITAGQHRFQAGHVGDAHGNLRAVLVPLAHVGLERLVVLPTLVAHVVEARGGDGDVFAQRRAGADLGLHFLEGAIADVGVDPLLAVGLAGDQLDRAGHRVAAVERTLRAAQHFDAHDVGEVIVRGRQARLVHVVDVHRDGRFRGDAAAVDLERAAHADRDGVRRGGHRGDLKAGGAGRDVLDLHDDALLEHVVGDRGDRDGGVLQRLFTALRRDEDLSAGFGRGRGRAWSCGVNLLGCGYVGPGAGRCCNRCHE